MASFTGAYPWITSFLLIISFTLSFGQIAPPNQSEQDCFGAIPICQTTYVQPRAYSGTGRYNEINGAYSCMRIGERNSVWYTFTVQTGGSLCFTISPFDTLDDYDWALFDLTQASCGDIPNNPALELSCNWVYNLGCQGRTGANNNVNCGPQNEPCLLVQAGQTFALNVSNFNGSNNGYTLDLSSSVAQLYDNVPPRLESLAPFCEGVGLRFSENVSCASVDVNDFQVSGPAGAHQVVEVRSRNCQGGGDFGADYQLVLQPAITLNGSYQVRLTGSVNDLCGNASLSSVESINLVAPPQAKLDSVAGQCVGGNSFRFTYSGSLPVRDYQWEFGDSTGSTHSYPLHSYQTAGLKRVQLVVTDRFGCSDTTSTHVEVFPGPVAEFDAPSRICLGDSLILHNLTRGASLHAYTWRFADGAADQTSLNAVYQFQAPGLWAVDLTAIGPNGCQDTHMQRIMVYPRPQVDFVMEQRICWQDSAWFLDQSDIRSDIAGGYLQAWEWDYGDSSRLDSGQEQVHYYAEPGLYPVSLTVTSDKGCEGKGIRDIEVYQPPPPDRENDTLCLGNKGILSATSAEGGQIVWYQDSTDGGAPFHWGEVYFPGPVLEPLRYWVETQSVEGCVSDRAEVKAVIVEQGEAYIWLADSQLTLVNPLAHFFFEPGNLRVDSLRWDFGDRQQSSEATPVHRYAAARPYEAKLWVKDVYGCSFEFEILVRVRKQVAIYAPTAFTPNGDGINDTWALSALALQQLDLRVFDRFGKLVFATEQATAAWDGRSQEGQDLPEGVYVFALRALDHKGDQWQEEGTITLLR